MTSRETFYDVLQKRGVSRRDFIKFCTMTAAALGLDASGAVKIAEALETKPRPVVLWRNFQECTCCSEAFIRSAHPITADVVLNLISLDYQEVLMAAAGHQAEHAIAESIKNNKGKYIYCVEGTVPLGEDGYYCTIGGRSAIDILKEEAKDAAAIIAWGNCATYGCVQAAKPNPTTATPIQDIIKDKPIINVPGCPPIPDVMAGVVAHYLTFEKLPELDSQGRPKAFYAHRIHDKCNRRAYFDAGLFVESFDDEGAKQGWCLYKMGCKGPNTYNSCSNMGWNEGVSYPIKSGHPCIGCSEKDFWDNNGGKSMYTHLSDVPGLRIGKSVDEIGVAALGAAAAGVAAHAALSAVAKAKNAKKDEEIGG